MPERLFAFVQFDMPFQPGPPPGRYVVRDRSGAAASHVIVFATLRAAGARSRRVRRWMRTSGERDAARAGVVDAEPGTAEATNEPASGTVVEDDPARPRPIASDTAGQELATGTLPGRPAVARTPSAKAPPAEKLGLARITVIDAAALPARQEAEAWLRGIDAEREVGAALGVVNRALFAHRQAAADPHVHELVAAQSIAIRAGWGTGEEAAHGRFAEARPLPPEALAGSARTRRARAGALLPSLTPASGDLRGGERFALLLGGREQPMLCEELALRARLDLAQGRPRLAAVELAQAYAAALAELPASGAPGASDATDAIARAGTPGRAHGRRPVNGRAPATEHAGRAAAGRTGTTPSGHRAAASLATDRVAELRRGQPEVAGQAAVALAAASPVDEEAIGRALQQLEAALRARAVIRTAE